MRVQESETLLKDAAVLFQRGAYSHALELLLELNGGGMPSRDVVYGIARCYLFLGRHEEARDAAQHLARRYHDPRGNALLAEIPEADDAVAVPDIGFTDADRAALPGPVVLEDSWGWNLPDWRWLAGIAVAILLVAVIIVPLIMSSTGAATAPGNSVAASEIVWGVLGWIVAYVLLLPAFYFTLWLFSQHQEEFFVDKLKQAAICLFLGQLLGLIPVVGFLVWFVLLSKFYDMEWPMVVIFYVVQSFVLAGFLLAYFAVLSSAGVDVTAFRSLVGI